MSSDVWMCMYLFVCMVCVCVCVDASSVGIRWKQPTQLLNQQIPGMNWGSKCETSIHVFLIHPSCRKTEVHSK